MADISYIKGKNKVFEKHRRKTILYNPARCGGTFIQQITDCIFYPAAGAVHDHHLLRFSLPVIAVYRDWRDKGASHYRICERQKEFTDKERFDSAFGIAIEDIVGVTENKKAYWNDPDFLWLRYEDFYNNSDFVCKKLEEFCDIKIPDWVKDYIREETSIKKNLKSSDEVKKLYPELTYGWDDRRLKESRGLMFEHVNPKTKGEPGSWKEIIPEEFHREVEKRLEPYLKEWNYIK